MTNTIGPPALGDGAGPTDEPVPAACFELFADLADILAQMSLPETPASAAAAAASALTPASAVPATPEAQALAVAAKVSALVAKIHAAHDTVRQLPRAAQTEAELRRMLSDYEMQLSAAKARQARILEMAHAVGSAGTASNAMQVE
ncbi:hypothetical protein HK105_202707 [Polyrhizophydium stewartii]|uniref:Mediator of RNA polymerase II transcription subunit 9 n=1 Tax=Polyrhizophydium stewartii TaxID=2732419 RepID=A0ABR4NED1_9FUNG|nr:hypothetical protein HK105_000016 [Polyrhizophydium stewartii]